jgi:hypothetical protein
MISNGGCESLLVVKCKTCFGDEVADPGFLKGGGCYKGLQKYPRTADAEGGFGKVCNCRARCNF